MVVTGCVYYVAVAERQCLSQFEVRLVRFYSSSATLVGLARDTASCLREALIHEFATTGGGSPVRCLYIKDSPLRAVYLFRR